MPGHVVKKKPGEEDPDPTPFLVVSLEMKREDQQKPYDPKKSYWCPNGLKEDKAGFMECMLEADDGTKATVMCGHEVKITIILLKNNNIYSFGFCIVDLCLRVLLIALL